MMTYSQKTVLITGCSSGFGRLMVRTCLTPVSPKNSRRVASYIGWNKGIDKVFRKLVLKFRECVHLICEADLLFLKWGDGISDPGEGFHVPD